MARCGSRGTGRWGVVCWGGSDISRRRVGFLLGQLLSGRRDTRSTLQYGEHFGAHGGGGKKWIVVGAEGRNEEGVVAHQRKRLGGEQVVELPQGTKGACGKGERGVRAGLTQAEAAVPERQGRLLPRDVGDLAAEHRGKRRARGGVEGS